MRTPAATGAEENTPTQLLRSQVCCCGAVQTLGGELDDGLDLNRLGSAAVILAQFELDRFALA